MSYLRDERGASAVEFAIVLPVIVMMLFAIFEFGLAYFRSQGLQAAAREGARVASLSQTTVTQIHQTVTSALSGVPFPTAPSVAVDPMTSRPCNLRSGQTVRVTVSAPTQIEIPFFGVRNTTLHGAGEFRCE